MDSHHRKIDLQSPADMTYLLNNIKHAAQQKLDEAIPRSAAPQGEDDAYRNRVEELVQQYILQTLNLALPSLSINGFDASPALLSPQPPPNASNPTASLSSNTTSEPSDSDIAAGNYEPYDSRLAERLRALYVQFEHEAEDVSRMRRDVPRQAAENYMRRLKQEEEELGMAEEEKKGVKKEEGMEGLEGEELGEALKGLGDRRVEVERVWERGCRDLEELEGITGVIARLEQAGRAVEIVEGR